ncbi:MAG: recombinase family protein [Alphaproteobacteria bacterium]|nr:recombinase family protein [Alphaproteobacteria bacterium]MBU0793507.1 recombinase family protein [Alphaproteobacteria bacterium]MBU0877712.1 recombinase family protein [Alphaproteobacteria bacterium]MBU1770047.1 recombinase family protein [Alphaproteobacteria bacterium]
MARRQSAAERPRGAVRCAVYTRKSSEEGLEQAFNSLDAQREACEAYIVSQRHEGWTLVKTAYDDGGYSGGSMDRPALGRLMADVEAGKIDVIVVYKVDRLTRALSDFARIVEILDARDASFVSVTQAFNTTSSMGRLTLNVLLSFAQFEREVTGERIRDKIAASKKKGMWMGGNPPLGYDVKDRALVINETEASQVRHIMTRYVALGSIPALVEELLADGYRTKQLHGRGGIAFSRGALSHLLGNAIYRGKVVHKGTVYDGQHQAIIGEALWDAVQRQLTEGRNDPSPQRAPKRSLLVGILRDGDGRKMAPTHTAKAGKRYRYYVTHPSALIGTGDKPWRVSATEVERIVIDRLRSWLVDRRAIMDLVGPADAVKALNKAAQASTDLDKVVGRAALITTLLSRIDIAEDGITLTIDREGIRTMLRLEQLSHDHPLQLASRATRIRQGKDVRMVVSDAQDCSIGVINQPLVALIAEARELHQALLRSPDHSVASLADALGKCRKRSAQLLRISTLAPDIVAQCIDGTQPVSLTTKQLLNADLPISWSQQRIMFGCA